MLLAIASGNSDIDSSLEQSAFNVPPVKDGDIDTCYYFEHYNAAW